MVVDVAKIAVDELVCESLLDHLRAEVPSHIHKINLGGERVEIVRVPQMLYLPDQGLQIFRGRVVPREAILDDTALILVKHALIENGRSVSYSTSEFNYCDDEVCILSNISSNVFYHWLEEMYKVVILENFGFDGKYVVSGLPSFAYEFLDLVGIACERIVMDLHDATVFRSAILTTQVCHLDVLAHRGVFFAMRDAIVAADVSKEPLLGERLWLDRGQHTTDKTRDVVNAREVEECVRRHGFTVVDMGALSVRQQLAAIRCARVIGGPHGSALTHCIFLQERSTIIECFSPHYINPSVLGICRNLDHRYFQIVSANDAQSDVYPYGYKVEIDCFHLELVFQSIKPSELTTRAFGTANLRHRSSGSSSMGCMDPLSRRTYEDVVAEHEARIAAALRQIDQDIASNESADGAASKHLRTMRVLLRSGIFDPDFYLQAYDDVRSAGADPLEHYVNHGDREGRWPNQVFWPWYYRLAGPQIPSEQNALEHYVEHGERAGRMPNRTFDPRAYITANRALSQFVDKPLFHFLKIGKAAGLKPSST